MKSLLTATWFVVILALTWISSDANHGPDGMFHQVLPSQTTPGSPTHHKNKSDNFSSIFNGVSVDNRGGSIPGFEPVGKSKKESPDLIPTASPTDSNGSRHKGHKDEKEASTNETQPETQTPVASPTVSPTASETISALQGEETSTIDRPIQQKAAVVSEPRTIQLKGAFDPRQSEQVIFEAVESLMEPFMQTHGGSIIQSFELSLTFMHEYDHMTSVQGASIMTMYFEVDVVFFLTSFDIDALADFSRTRATKLVEQFFSGNQLTRLLRRLERNGIMVQDAQLFTSLPANIPRSETGDIYQPPSDTQETSKSGVSTILYAAVASGAIMFFTIVCVIVISKREFRKSIKTVLGSFPGSKRSTSSCSVSSSSSTVSGGIKPAALHVRRKKEEEQARQLETSSFDDFSYSDKNFGSKFVRSHQPFLFKRRLGAKPRQDEYIDDDDEDSSLDRLEDGLVASGALTCLDQERSEISAEYPEFEVFAHIPRPVQDAKPKLPVPPASPVWSVSATSYDIGSVVEDSDYAEQRRRWQDQQLDDLALVALPDHTSDLEGDSSASSASNNDRSDDENSKVTRNSSYASESTSVKIGLRREDHV